jgi:hypothetical protein
MAQTVSLVVDTGSVATSVGDFSLTIDLAAPTPALSSIVAACDDLSAATALLSSATMPAIGDDVAGPNTPLPFTVQFLGTAAANFSATSNGLLQFFPSTGTGSTAFTNVAIPATAAPNAFAAPLWDDLRNVSTTVVRSATFGTMPNRRFTVEWFDSTFVGAAERVRFQVQVFETTNVVEFHYCSMNVNASSDPGRAFGASATIGIEDSAGAAGVQAGFNRPNSAATGSGYRFTP